MLKNFNLCMINIILKGKIVINIAFEKYKNFYYFFFQIYLNGFNQLLLQIKDIFKIFK